MEVPHGGSQVSSGLFCGARGFKLTRRAGRRISRRVIRLRPLLTVLLMAVWIPIQCPWAGALAILVHEADEVHEASLSWKHGHLHVVLQHPRTASEHAAQTRRDGIIQVSATHDEDADHVFHPLTLGQFLRASATNLPAYARLCSGLARSRCAAMPEHRVASWRALALSRSSPEIDSPRTTILVI